MARSRNGFTLLEVLVALWLFAVAVGSLSALLVTTIRANAHASRITQATNLAQDKLEEIRNTPTAAVTSGTDAPAVAGSPQGYVRSWTVRAGPTATTKTVLVAVEWADQQSNRVELDTVIGG